MASRPFEELRPAIDPAPARPPQAAGSALRAADAGLRLLLAAVWLELAPDANAVGAAGLVAAATLAWAGVAPRLLTGAGTALAVSVAWPERGASAAGVLLVAGAVRLRLHLGAAGAWLRTVRQLECRRNAALAATGLALARRRTAGLGGSAEAVVQQAGDSYEAAGRARAALEAAGARPARWTEALERGVAWLGRRRSAAPALRSRPARD